jgi:hypothetical protein
VLRELQIIATGPLEAADAAPSEKPKSRQRAEHRLYLGTR